MLDIEEIKRTLDIADKRVKARIVPTADIPEGVWWRFSPFPTEEGSAITSDDWDEAFSTLPDWAPAAYELFGMGYEYPSIAACYNKEDGTTGLNRWLERATKEEY